MNQLTPLPSIPMGAGLGAMLGYLLADEGEDRIAIALASAGAGAAALAMLHALEAQDSEKGIIRPVEGYLAIGALGLLAAYSLERRERQVVALLFALYCFYRAYALRQAIEAARVNRTEQAARVAKLRAELNQRVIPESNAPVIPKSRRVYLVRHAELDALEQETA